MPSIIQPEFAAQLSGLRLAMLRVTPRFAEPGVSLGF
jgi:hypothetical protein